MKSTSLFFVALLALFAGKIAAEVAQAQLTPTPRQLELDDHKVGEPELMEEKMELFDEMDNPNTDIGVSKAEIDYFTIPQYNPDAQPETPSIIVQDPLDTRQGLEDENGYQEMPIQPVVIPPQISEIEETHEYLVQHDLVLDLHNQHLTAAYENLRTLEAQFIALADDIDSGNSKLPIDANTRELLTNFAAHLVYIQDEQVFEHGNPVPPLYDFYLNRMIDFEQVIEESPLSEDEGQSTQEKVENLSFQGDNGNTTSIDELNPNDADSETWLAARKVMGIAPSSVKLDDFEKNAKIGQKSYKIVPSMATSAKNPKSRKQASIFKNGKIQWRIKSDLLQKNAIPGAESLKKTLPSVHHDPKLRFNKQVVGRRKNQQNFKNGNRQAMVVDTDTGFRYPYQYGRNPWSKTRFDGYIRPVLQDHFGHESLMTTNHTIDDLVMYYNSSYELLVPPKYDETVRNSGLLDINDDAHVYGRIKMFSQIGYFVLEQIWNDLNQINTDFHTIPNNHLNTLAFFDMRPIHDRIRCRFGNEQEELQQFDLEIQMRHQEFREKIAEIIDKIESCETDVFSVLSITDFYRNFKGDESMDSPGFVELLDHVHGDMEELDTLKQQATINLEELKNKMGELWEVRDHIRETLENFEPPKAGVWLLRSLVTVWAVWWLFQ